jgi:hypothetical protein
MVYTMEQLVLNLKIADEWATVDPTDEASDGPSIGGQTTKPVPTNMTALSNYVKGLNPRAFQSQGTTSQEAQDTGPPVNSRRAGSSQAYGVISISCDKDPESLVNQISYEWARFGNHLKIKELQAIETSTPFTIYFVYALSHHQTLIDEQQEILKAAQKQIHNEDYFIEHDLPIRWGYCPLPLCSLRMSIPRIPKHSEPTNVA